MSKVRQVLRLHAQGYKKLRIAEQTAVVRNTVKKYIKEFTQSGLSFSEIDQLSDTDLEDLFIKPADLSVWERLFRSISVTQKMFC